MADEETEKQEEPSEEPPKETSDEAPPAEAQAESEEPAVTDETPAPEPETTDAPTEPADVPAEPTEAVTDAPTDTETAPEAAPEEIAEEPTTDDAGSAKPVKSTESAKEEVAELEPKSSKEKTSQAEIPTKSTSKVEASESMPGIGRTSSEFVGEVGGSGTSLRQKGSSLGELKDGPRKSQDQQRLSGKAQRVLGSSISIKRLSGVGDIYDKKGARFANTYKLDADNPFNAEKTEKILKDVMTEALENLTYDADKCAKQAKWASTAIRAKLKELEFDRYKLICFVSIGEKTSQDVFVTCRFLWDADRDRYASFALENTFVFGIALCFGLYYE